MLLSTPVVLITAWYTDTSFFCLLTSYKSKLKVKIICGVFKLIWGECTLFYLRKQCQGLDLNKKNLSVVLQGQTTSVVT